MALTGSVSQLASCVSDVSSSTPDVAKSSRPTATRPSPACSSTSYTVGRPSGSRLRRHHTARLVQQDRPPRRPPDDTRVQLDARAFPGVTRTAALRTSRPSTRTRPRGWRRSPARATARRASTERGFTGLCHLLHMRRRAVAVLSRRPARRLLSVLHASSTSRPTAAARSSSARY